MLVTIVIPCYNSEKTIGKVVRMIMREFETMQSYTCDFVLVNDASKDGTFEEIRKLCKEYPTVTGINLMRNFGQHNALMAAMNYAKGDFIMGMDDDMQTHPSQMIKLIAKIEEGYDLVYGHYGKKKNSFMKNLSSKFNQVSSRILLGRPKEIVSSNFWIITRAVAQEVIKYKSCNPYVDGIFYRITHNVADVQIEHHEREVGTSNYTLRKLMKLWLAYWNFSVIPLRAASFLGMLFACASVVAALIVCIVRLVSPDMTVGWASVICVITFFSGLILMVLGIIGEYLGKIVMVMNNAPQYIVREELNAKKDPSRSKM